MKTCLTPWISVVITFAAFSMDAAEPAIKTVYAEDFMIGSAVNRRQFSDSSNQDVPIIEKHFNTITPENALKWGSLQRQPGSYYFDAADRFVEFGTERAMTIIGHTLVWHSQTPRWVFQGEDGKPPTREVMLERMRHHIYSVVGRYKGRVHGWDVVNEALNEDGTLRPSPWLRSIGEDYLEKAFQFANEVDPDAELYYNDYSLNNPRKRDGAVRLVKKLQSAGLKIDGIGMQAHYRLETPKINQIEDSIKAFSKLGIKVMFTELDIKALPTPGPGSADLSRRIGSDPKWNPYPDGLPAEVQQSLAERYADLFRLLIKYRESISRVTFWGVTDQSSWLNNFPIRGRTDYPLLFGRDRQPKSAFHAVIQVASERPKNAN
jgi:endo-1,4-beta-xylanase